MQLLYKNIFRVLVWGEYYCCVNILYIEINVNNITQTVKISIKPEFMRVTMQCYSHVNGEIITSVPSDKVSIFVTSIHQ